MYDSRPETYEHIARVRRLIHGAVNDLMRRGEEHDLSKLEDPEVSGWNEATPRLKDLTYGTDEYREELQRIKPLVEHHYKLNDHHPEHWGGGIEDMNLMVLIEMLCDWKAAGERHSGGGDIRRSIEHNQERFGYSDELKQILINTVEDLWDD
jgi:hypothetical protein